MNAAHGCPRDTLGGVSVFLKLDERTEWLEADALGGFASGTTSGVRTHRYHALLLTATTQPTARIVLVNGFDAWLDTPTGSFALSTQRYAPDVLYPDGTSRIASFTADPWPTWEFDTPDGTRIIQEICVQHGTGATILVWRLPRGRDPVELRVRPFLSGRDYHALHHENGTFRFDSDQTAAVVAFRPYEELPAVICSSNGRYEHAPDWYRQFLYTTERECGLDDTEDLASPGVFSWSLAKPGGEAAVWMLEASAVGPPRPRTRHDVLRLAAEARDAERRRRDHFSTPLDRATETYPVQRGSGRTIVAEYPWHTEECRAVAPRPIRAGRIKPGGWSAPSAKSRAAKRLKVVTPRGPIDSSSGTVPSDPQRTSTKEPMANNRREFMGIVGETAAAFSAMSASGVGAAIPTESQFKSIRALAFGAYGTLFDVYSVTALCDELFPGNGNALAQLWRAIQLQDSLLRSLMGRYKDFWQLTEEGLLYASKSLKLDLTPGKRKRLMDAYLNLAVFPDVKPGLEALKTLGLRLAILSNGEPKMLAAATKSAGIETFLDAIISADELGIFNPSPALYGLAPLRLRVPVSGLGFVSSNSWDVS
jgi:2-haloalkanoic acid dehalogenase type II